MRAAVTGASHELQHLVWSLTLSMSIIRSLALGSRSGIYLSNRSRRVDVLTDASRLLSAAVIDFNLFLLIFLFYPLRSLSSSAVSAICLLSQKPIAYVPECDHSFEKSIFCKSS